MPSGLQYKVIQEGTGKNPKAGDVVVVHYRGARIDGTEFDSTYRRNEPATFKLEHEGQIKGWIDALLMMKEGAKWQIFIPSDLAYGENGAGPHEPNATLIYDAELITIYAALATPSHEAKPGTHRPGRRKNLRNPRQHPEAGSGKVALSFRQVTGVDG